MKNFSLLLVDDEILTLNNLKKILEKEGYEIHLADSGEKALEMVEIFRPHLILLDLMLPGISGLEVLRRIKDTESEVIVIMMTAYEILEKAVEAMKLGAYDYLLKPFKMSELKATIRRALETLSLRLKVQDHLQSQKGQYYFGRIVGASTKFKQVLETAKKVALSDRTTVLLQGESGTGKELFAKAIHYQSPRAENAIVDINCAAIPETLMESELFGYEAGAFTDARKRKIGLLEKGDGGTVFFDEIGELSMNLQAKLLRVLEEGSYTRLGGDKILSINIRVIAATNKDLSEAVENTTFRADLFYRLNVVPITIPPLRDRPEDIISLAFHFMQEFNKDLKRNFTSISQSAADIMRGYPWPGNVRELRNIIERIMSLYIADEILPTHLPLEIRNFSPPAAGANQRPELSRNDFLSLEKMEKRYILEVLKKTEGNKSQAARILEIHPTSLFRKLKNWDL